MSFWREVIPATAPFGKHIRSTESLRAKRRQTVELLIVGGNANNFAQCGVAYSNSNNRFGNSNTNIGARLKLSLFNNVHKTEHTVEPVFGKPIRLKEQIVRRMV